MKKSLLKIALSALLVAVVLVGGTLAYLVTQTGVLTNTFAVVNIDTEVVEDPGSGEGSAKAPYVLNKSNVPVYVRAYAVVSSEGSVPVSAGDVEINFDYEGTKWQRIGDYYYYTEAVPAGQSTDKLFDGVKVNITDSNANFSVYVYHESVQAKDTTLTDVSKIAALFG